MREAGPSSHGLITLRSRGLRGQPHPAHATIPSRTSLQSGKAGEPMDRQATDARTILSSLLLTALLGAPAFSQAGRDAGPRKNAPPRATAAHALPALDDAGRAGSGNKPSRIENVWRHDANMSRRDNISRIIAETNYNISQTAQAACTITPSWTNDDFNRYLDGDNSTHPDFGRTGCSADDPVHGETVNMAGGNYILPPNPSASYNIRIPITLAGPADPRSTSVENTAVLSGHPDVLSPGAIIRVFSPNVNIMDLNIRHGNVGIYFRENYGNNVVQRVVACSDETYGPLRTPGTLRAEFNPGDNSLPSVLFDSLEVDNTEKGFFHEDILGNDATTRFYSVTNCRINGVSDFAIQPATYVSGSGGLEAAAGILITLGVDDMIGNLFTNSGGAPFIPEIFGSTPPMEAIFVGQNGTVSAGNTGPKWNGEWNVAQNDPNYVTLAASNTGIGNVDTDPQLDIYGRPGWNSETVGPHLPKGHMGSRAPVFDINESGTVDKGDFGGFKTAFYKTNTTLADKIAHDFDGNDVIDLNDFGEWQRLYEQHGGTNGDCNGNGRNDLEDVLLETSPDGNNDLSPDECCAVVAPAAVNASGFVQGRYISLIPPANSGQTTAIRVRLADLRPPHDSFNGQYRWVGQPREISELGGSTDPTPGIPNFMASRLQCEPFYMDWSTVGPLQVFGSEIIPGSFYDLQVIGGDCASSFEASYSVPLNSVTGTWGDTVGQFDTENEEWTSPDGDTAIIDVVSILDKFKSAPTAPSKARVDLEPATPDQLINITDVTRALDAFSGAPYPFSLESCPND